MVTAKWTSESSVRRRRILDTTVSVLATRHIIVGNHDDAGGVIERVSIFGGNPLSCAQQITRCRNVQLPQGQPATRDGLHFAEQSQEPAHYPHLFLTEGRTGIDKQQMCVIRNGC